MKIKILLCEDVGVRSVYVYVRVGVVVCVRVGEYVLMCLCSICVYGHVWEWLCVSACKCVDVRKKGWEWQ